MTSSSPAESKVWEIRSLRRRAAIHLDRLELPDALKAISRAEKLAAALASEFPPADERAEGVRTLARFTELEHAVVKAVAGGETVELNRLLTAVRSLQDRAAGTRTLPGDLARTVFAAGERGRGTSGEQPGLTG